jgi:hypothetical protein
MNDRCKLIDDFLRGKIEKSVCVIVEKLYDLFELDISDNLKSHLYITIGLIYQKQLTPKEEQEINNTLDTGKKSFNNTPEQNKEEVILSVIKKILEVIC